MVNFQAAIGSCTSRLRAVHVQARVNFKTYLTSKGFIHDHVDH